MMAAAHWPTFSVARSDFGAGRNALVLDTADLDRPFPGHNPQLLEMLNPALVAALAEATAPASMACK